MSTKIVLGKPIVLHCLRHSQDFDMFGIKGRRGDPIVLPAPRTEAEVASMREISRTARESGRRLRRAFLAKAS